MLGVFSSHSWNILQLKDWVHLAKCELHCCIDMLKTTAGRNLAVDGTNVQPNQIWQGWNGSHSLIALVWSTLLHIFDGVVLYGKARTTLESILYSNRICSLVSSTQVYCVMISNKVIKLKLFFGPDEFWARQTDIIFYNQRKCTKHE